jgi:hypothetical protein
LSTYQTSSAEAKNMQYLIMWNCAHLPSSGGNELEKWLCAMFSECRFFMPSIRYGISPVNWLCETSISRRPAMDIHSFGSGPFSSLFATSRVSATKFHFCKQSDASLLRQIMSADLIDSCSPNPTKLDISLGKNPRKLLLLRRSSSR